MLKTETVIIGGREFTHSYSDEGFYIKQNGTDAMYAEAYDLAGNGMSYTETTKKIKAKEREEDNE